MRTFILFSFLLLFSPVTKAQDFNNPGDYIDYINKADESLSLKYLAYLSAASHGKSARKVEKRRLDVVAAIGETRSTISGMPPFKGDRSLRDTAIVYLKMLYSVFNEDYGKIVNMEDIAEQSYDAMEAYMTAKEQAWAKLGVAQEKQHETLREFAKKYNINLIENESPLSEKSKAASEVLKHANTIYLIFFKSYKQEAYFMEALNKKDMVALDQDINTLKKYSEEGLEKLKQQKGYENDGSLIEACRIALNFYKSEAVKASSYTDFMVKEESFQKIKKLFESKPESKRTQQDVNEYNKAVNDMNAAVNNYNSVNNDLNKERAEALKQWNNTYDDYLNRYMPRQSKQ